MSYPAASFSRYIAFELSGSWPASENDGLDFIQTMYENGKV